VGGVAANRLARWNGTTWSAIGAGLGLGSGSALAVAPQGELAVGGTFTTANGAPSAFVARLTTPCVATTTVAGVGCNGSSGPVAMSADNRPWIGTTFRATATGIGPSSFALGMIGFAPSATPASSLHPAGLPGCTLLVSPDDVSLLFPVAGAVHTQLGLPNNMIYVGAVLHVQVAQVELDAQLAITQISASNALTLTVGSF